MKLAASFLWLIVLFGCSRARKEPAPESPTARAEAVFAESSRRLLENHVQNGYVVSRKADGSPDHEGEGILWAGVAAAALDCDDAKVIVDQLAGFITERNGEIRRIEPLPAEYAGRELNFDGETGLIFGLASYAVHCPAARALVAAAWQTHQQSIAEHGGELYPGTGEKMAPGFGFTSAALTAYLTGGSSPGGQGELEAAASAWVSAVSTSWSAYKAGLVSAPAACYPANLAFLHLRTAEALGYRISDGARQSFCGAAAAMAIPLIDDWCGGGDLAGWIDGYVPNEWEYRFQRCAPPWEEPDGEGDETPQVDLLIAIRQKYDLPN